MLVLEEASRSLLVKSRAGRALLRKFLGHVVFERFSSIRIDKSTTIFRVVHFRGSVDFSHTHLNHPHCSTTTYPNHMILALGAYYWLPLSPRASTLITFCGGYGRRGRRFFVVFVGMLSRLWPWSIMGDSLISLSAGSSLIEPSGLGAHSDISPLTS